MDTLTLSKKATEANNRTKKLVVEAQQLVDRAKKARKSR